MKRKVQEPTITKDDSPIGGERVDHPAFAQIGASRISGSRSLYGSDFLHQGFIRIRISESQLHRTLSTDWAHARKTHIEVDLSEAQWAHFVSTLNSGTGTQCTLAFLRGEDIPYLPDPISRRDQFTNEAKDAAAEAMAAVKELRDVINDANASKKLKEELTAKADAIERRLMNNIPFVLEQFGEHMEATVEKAKIEINAYATQTVMRADIKELGGTKGGLPVISLDPSSDPKDSD